MNECSISTFGSIRVTCQRGLTIKALIKKQPKKQYGYAALASAALFIGGVATTDSSQRFHLMQRVLKPMPMAQPPSKANTTATAN